MPSIMKQGKRPAQEPLEASSSKRVQRDQDVEDEETIVVRGGVVEDSMEGFGEEEEAMSENEGEEQDVVPLAVRGKGKGRAKGDGKDETELSSSTKWKLEKARKINPHLEGFQYGGGPRLSLDMSSTASFEAIRIRGGDWEKIASPDNKDQVLRAIRAIGHIFDERKAEATNDSPKYTGRIVSGPARKMEEIDRRKCMNWLVKHSSMNTLAVLGKDTGFEIADLDDMRAMTDEDLDKWIIYVVTAVRKVEGKPVVRRYVGKSTNSGGSKWRILEDYEKVRKARQGILTGTAIENEWIVRALVPGTEVYLHPFVAMDIPDPDDVEAWKDGERWFSMWEGFMVDMIGTLRDGDERYIDPNGPNKRLVNDRARYEASRDLAPAYMVKNWIGDNKGHPLHQGWAVGDAVMPPGAIAAYDYLATLSNRLCQCCGQSEMGPNNLASNRLVDVVGFLEGVKYFCKGCGLWSYNQTERGRLEELKKHCESLPDLVKYRQLSIGRGSKIEKILDYQEWRKQAAELEELGCGCPVCAGEIRAPKANESMWDAVPGVTLDETLAVRPGEGLTTAFKFLRGDILVCKGCENFFRGMKRSWNSPASRAMLEKWYEVTSIAQAKALRHSADMQPTSKAEKRNTIQEEFAALDWSDGCPTCGGNITAPVPRTGEIGDNKITHAMKPRARGFNFMAGVAFTCKSCYNYLTPSNANRNKEYKDLTLAEAKAKRKAYLEG